jgi:hypothetical protein
MGNSRGKDHLGHLTALVRVRHAVPLRITAVYRVANQFE